MAACPLCPQLAAAPKRWVVLRDRGFRSLASLPPEMLRTTYVDAATRRADVVTSDQMRMVEVFGDTAY